MEICSKSYKVLILLVEEPLSKRRSRHFPAEQNTLIELQNLHYSMLINNLFRLGKNDTHLAQFSPKPFYEFNLSLVMYRVLENFQIFSDFFNSVTLL